MMLLLGLQTTPENTDIQGDRNKKKWKEKNHAGPLEFYQQYWKQQHSPTTILRNKLAQIDYSFTFL